MDQATQEKWNRAAKSFDFMNGIGPDKRWAADKAAPYVHPKLKQVQQVNVNVNANDLEALKEGARDVGLDPEKVLAGFHPYATQAALSDDSG